MRLRLWLAIVLTFVGLRPAAAQEAVEYYATDALASVRIVFAANGTVNGRMDFGPHGEQMMTAEGIGQTIYAGVRFDAETAMVYAEARQFRSRTGRFNRPDPLFRHLGDPQRLNRYGYARNNPATFVDPSGLDECTSDPATGELNCNVDVPGSDPGTDPGAPEGGDDTGGGHCGGDPPAQQVMRPFACGPPGDRRDGDERDGSTDDGRQGPDETTTPDTQSPPSQSMEATVQTPLQAFVKGCGEGAAIVADAAIPFGDPFEGARYYSDSTPGRNLSRFLADVSLGILDVAMGVRGLAELTRGAVRGTTLYRINNNQTVRVGYSMWPRTQGRVPRVSIPRFGGRHWDLRICGR